MFRRTLTAALLSLACVAALPLLSCSGRAATSTRTIAPSIEMTADASATTPSAAATGQSAPDSRTTNQGTGALARGPRKAAAGTIAKAGSVRGGSSADAPTATIFGFITAANGKGHRGAAITVDLAELHPADENAPPGSAGELDNPTKESITLPIASTATIDTGTADHALISVQAWLKLRGDPANANLARSPYWIVTKNGIVVGLRVQPM